MSHVAEIELDIKDEDCLRAAAIEIGLEVREKNTYKWYGRHVGDYPVPEGFTIEDLGKCDFALGIPGNTEAYEIGVVRRPDGIKMVWDFWAGGHGLLNAIGGKKGERLCQEYGVQVAIKEAKRLGAKYISRELNENGEVEIIATGRKA